MDMLELKEIVRGLAKASDVRRYGHMLRRDDDNVARAAQHLEASGKSKQRTPKT